MFFQNNESSPFTNCSMPYIFCRNDKRPDGNHTYPFFEANNFREGAGIPVYNPFVVIDADDSDTFEAIKNLLSATGIVAPTMQTDRGGHFWFRSPRPLKNMTKARTPILLDVDLKSGFSNKTFMLVKRYGNWRQGLVRTTIEDCPELPYGLTPKPKGGTSICLEDFATGGRNDAFFRLKLPLATKFGLVAEEIKTVLELINEYLIDQPLDQKELDSISRVENFNTHQEYENAFFLRDSLGGVGELKHNIYGDYLIMQCHIKRYNGVLGFYIAGQYRHQKIWLNNFIRKLTPCIHRTQLKEIYEYIFDYLPEETDVDTTYIALNNCLYHAITGVYYPHNPAVFAPRQLNLEYAPDILEKYGDVIDCVDEKILDIFSNEVEAYLLFTEIIGYILGPGVDAEVAFIFYGEGSNGKSLILENIIREIFSGNTTSLSIQQMNDRFALAQLATSMANINSDETGNPLTDTTTLKKLITGDEVFADIKYHETGIHFANRAKLIMSFNTPPHAPDVSYGFRRRFVYLNFKQKFSAELGNLDRGLKSYIKNNLEIIKNYYFLLGTFALNRLKQNNFTFTTPPSSFEVEELFNRASNNVLVGIKDAEITYYTLHHKTVSAVYLDYSNWCESMRLKTIGQMKFRKTIYEQFGLDVAKSIVDGGRKNVFL